MTLLTNCADFNAGQSGALRVDVAWQVEQQICDGDIGDLYRLHTDDGASGSSLEKSDLKNAAIFIFLPYHAIQQPLRSALRDLRSRAASSRSYSQHVR